MGTVAIADVSRRAASAAETVVTAAIVRVSRRRGSAVKSVAAETGRGATTALASNAAESVPNAPS